ncbi:MAG: F-type H+-transporting ATPase subunit b [Sphingobacteriales bacterium]|jgi:F-type H+-transporting ATPase subunit b
MGLVTPGLGLIVWTTLSFSIVLFLLGKFAWKPIMAALKEREESIEDALASAEKAKEELSRLNEENEKVLAEARLEREKMLKEARSMRDNLISEAKGQAQTEADKIVEKAGRDIEEKKSALMKEVKSMVAVTSVEIAEKILRKELGNQDAQKEMVDGLLKDITLN